MQAIAIPATPPSRVTVVRSLGPILDSPVFRDPAIEAKALLDSLMVCGLGLMLDVLLQREIDDFVRAHRHHRDAEGHALVVRNGVTRLRHTRMGPVSVPFRAPRVFDARPRGPNCKSFVSAVLRFRRAQTAVGEHEIAAAFVQGWSSQDFSVLRHLIAVRGIAGGEEAKDAMMRLRARWSLHVARSALSNVVAVTVPSYFPCSI